MSKNFINIDFAYKFCISLFSYNFNFCKFLKRQKNRVFKEKDSLFKCRLLSLFAACPGKKKRELQKFFMSSDKSH